MVGGAKRTNRVLAWLAGAAALALVTGPAQALPSVAIVWQSSGSATLFSPAASSTLVADIVLTTHIETITGIFISIEFDSAELQAISANELATINLPGMGNEFSPISNFTAIDNELGLITGFDEATLATGLRGGHSVTLGSVTFQVVSATGDPGDIDVIASLQNVGTDDVVRRGDPSSIGVTFFGASLVPEPTTATLLAAGIAGLAYAARKRVG